MALYRYVKKHNTNSVLARLPSIRKQKAKIPRKMLAMLSGVFLIGGLFLLGQVVYPVLGWYVFTMPSYSATIKSPLSSTFQPQTKILGATNLKTNLPNITRSNAGDSYNVGTWFVGASSNGMTQGQSDIKVYNLSIPKLKIDQAIVEIGSMDLKKSLIGWPTSPLPGQFGNNIIFGHSELAQFASTTNYSGMFTHIMDLAVGDEILVDFDGVRYKYEVFDKTVVEPTDLSVLEQRFDAAYITLITCVPPGTVWKRGIVKGRLVEQ